MVAPGKGICRRREHGTIKKRFDSIKAESTATAAATTAR